MAIAIDPKHGRGRLELCRAHSPVLDIHGHEAYAEVHPSDCFECEMKAFELIKSGKLKTGWRY